MSSTDEAKKIDIDQLTEEEFIDLNHRIVERLRFLKQMQAHAQMLEFRIGDHVAFQTSSRETMRGMLTRHNKKTVTVIADDGRQWNVSPGFLTKLKEPNVIDDTLDNLLKVVPAKKK